MTGKELAEIILSYLEANDKYDDIESREIQVNMVKEICQDVIDEW